jgi:hypothetical protein
MSRQIVFPTIQQVLEMKTGFRFALHHQAALKEQCVGILTSQRQRDEVLQRTSHRHVRIDGGRSQPRRRDLECQRHARILDLQTEPLAREFTQTFCERLPTQHVIHRERYDVSGHVRGNGMQETEARIRIMCHDNLHDRGSHCCHGDSRDRLIRIKRSTQ